MHRLVTMRRVVAYVGRLIALALECFEDFSGYVTSRGILGTTRRLCSGLQ